MTKKIFTKSIIFFLPALLAVFIFSFNSPTAEAAEGQCHLENCLVPSPTILLPQINTINATGQINVVGLTWKRTIVKVYLDGVELAGVKQFDHEDYFAGFYLTASPKLKPGKHYLYTITHSEKPGWFDQSKESTYMYFTVPVVKPKPVAVINDQPVSSIVNKADNQTSNDGLGILASTSLATVDVAQGKIEGGVYVEAEQPGQANDALNNPEESIDDQLVQQTLPAAGPANSNLSELQNAGQADDLSDYLENEFLAEQVKQTAKRNRIIGLLGLAVLAIGFFIGRFVGKKDITASTVSQEPVIQASPSVPLANNYEPSIEEIAHADHIDYWVPGPTPYTPYPMPEEMEKESQKDKDKEFDK